MIQRASFIRVHPCLRISGPGYIRVGFVFNPTQKWDFIGGKTSFAGRWKFISLGKALFY